MPPASVTVRMAIARSDTLEGLDVTFLGVVLLLSVLSGTGCKSEAAVVSRLRAADSIVVGRTDDDRVLKKVGDARVIERTLDWVARHEDGWSEHPFSPVDAPVACKFYRGDVVLGTLLIGRSTLGYIPSVGSARYLSGEDRDELLGLLGLDATVMESKPPKESG